MTIKPSHAFAIAGVFAAGLLTAAANTNAIGAGSSADVGATGATAGTALVQAAPTQIGVDDLDVVVIGGRDGTERTATTTPIAATYQIGDAGLATVEVVGGELVITDLHPSDGWTAADPDDENPSSVYAVFADGSVLVELRIVYTDGALVPSLNSVAETVS